MTTPRGTVVRAGRALERFAEQRAAAPAVFGAALAVYGARLARASPAGGPRPAALPPRLRAALRRARRLPERDARSGRRARRSSSGLLLEAGPLVAEVGARRALRPLDRRVVLRRAAVRPGARRWRRPPRCSPTPATSSSSTSWRATRSSRPRSRSSRSCSSRARRAPDRWRASAVLGLGRRRRSCSRARSARCSLLLGLVPLVAARGRRAARRGGCRLRRRGRRPARRARRRTTRCAPTTSRSCAAGRRRSSSARSSRTGSSSPTTALRPRSSRERSSRELLPNEPYRSRGIDLETFFSSGSSRMHDDLTVLSDRTWGWDDDYRAPRRASAREAVRAHPGDVRARRRDATSGGCSSGRCTRRSRTAAAEPRPAPRRAVPRRAPLPGADRGRADPVLARGAVHLDAGRADPRGVDVADRPRIRLPRPGRRARGAAALDREVDALLDGLPGSCGQRPALVARS